MGSTGNNRTYPWWIYGTLYHYASGDEGVGAKYAGTDQGLIITLGQLGGSISPPLGNSLADIDSGFPFIFWAILAIVALSGFYFVKEAGQGKK